MCRDRNLLSIKIFCILGEIYIQRKLNIPKYYKLYSTISVESIESIESTEFHSEKLDWTDYVQAVCTHDILLSGQFLFYTITDFSIPLEYHTLYPL